MLEHVAHETAVYLEAGVDGLVIENMHDTPYCLEKVGDRSQESKGLNPFSGYWASYSHLHGSGGKAGCILI